MHKVCQKAETDAEIYLEYFEQKYSVSKKTGPLHLI